ncbi:MAG: hypothetical protein H6868_10025 [Rhodospirillales bacterium]|nr:hypothetical protein [Rhodospirillales bacterium]
MAEMRFSNGQENLQSPFTVAVIGFDRNLVAAAKMLEESDPRIRIEMMNDRLSSSDILETLDDLIETGCEHIARLSPPDKVFLNGIEPGSKPLHIAFSRSSDIEADVIIGSNLPPGTPTDDRIIRFVEGTPPRQIADTALHFKG